MAIDVKADGGEAPLPIRAAARLPKIAPVGRLHFRSTVRTRILRIRRISADWLMEGGNGVSAANVITLQAGGTPALPFTRNFLPVALRRKPPKILRTRRITPTCWIAAVSAAEEEKNASYRSLKKARVSLSHSERVPFCANSAFRIPNSELFRSLLFEPLNQFFIAAFFGAIQNGSFDCVFVVDFEWGLASVVFGVNIRAM